MTVGSQHVEAFRGAVTEYDQLRDEFLIRAFRLSGPGELAERKRFEAMGDDIVVNLSDEEFQRYVQQQEDSYLSDDGEGIDAANSDALTPLMTAEARFHDYAAMLFGMLDVTVNGQSYEYFLRTVASTPQAGSYMHLSTVRSIGHGFQRVQSDDPTYEALDVRLESGQSRNMIVLQVHGDETFHSTRTRADAAHETLALRAIQRLAEVVKDLRQDPFESGS